MATAAACSGSGVFTKWLSTKLISLNEDVDLDVFVSYIESILADDIPDDEKRESIGALLEQILVDDTVEDQCDEITKKWNETLVNGDDKVVQKEEKSLDATIQEIIGKQNVEASRVRVVDEQQMQLKAAILANYAQVSDGEDDDDDPGNVPTSNTTSSSATAGASSTSEDLLVKNMNALLVKERENKERDRSKVESEQKKQKDKDDREKQKQKDQDRKDSEKKRTQKGEKRR